MLAVRSTANYFSVPELEMKASRIVFTGQKNSQRAFRSNSGPIQAVAGILAHTSSDFGHVAAPFKQDDII